MCVIEVRMLEGGDGSNQRREYIRLCSRSDNGKPCDDTLVRHLEPAGALQNISAEKESSKVGMRRSIRRKKNFGARNISYGHKLSELGYRTEVSGSKPSDGFTRRKSIQEIETPDEPHRETTLANWKEMAKDAHRTATASSSEGVSATTTQTDATSVDDPEQERLAAVPRYYRYPSQRDGNVSYPPQENTCIVESFSPKATMSSTVGTDGQPRRALVNNFSSSPETELILSLPPPKSADTTDSQTNPTYYRALMRFHESCGRNLNPIPSLYKRAIDFFALKLCVDSYGGYQSVCLDKKWAAVGIDLGYGSKIAPIFLESSYRKWIKPYEDQLQNTKSSTWRNKSYARTRSPRRTASVLKAALEHARNAVAWDNVHRFERALTEYSSASASLTLVINDCVGEDKQKLMQIKETYTDRISQLQAITANKLLSSAGVDTDTGVNVVRNVHDEIEAECELQDLEYRMGLASLEEDQQGDASRIRKKEGKQRENPRPMERLGGLMSETSLAGSDDDSDDDSDWVQQLEDMGVDLEEVGSLILATQKLSPWIPIDAAQSFEGPKTIKRDFHIAHCSHFPPSQLSLGSKVGQEQPERVPTSQARRVVERACGLAGVLPLQGENNNWLSEAVVRETPYPSMHIDFSNTHLLDWGRVRSLMDACVNSISWMQQQELCCDSFTVLRLGSEDPRSTKKLIVQMLRVQFSLLCKFQQALREIDDSGNLRVALDPLDELLETFYGPCWSIPTEKSLFTIFKRALLAAQSCCLGIVLYMHGHGGPLKLSILDRSLERVVLGAQSSTEFGLQPCIKAVRLTCIGNMLQKPVMVFHAVNPDTRISRSHTGKSGYDLKACPSDIIDTWGPAQTLWTEPKLSPADRQILSVIINGGNVTAVSTVPGNLHWTAGYSEVNKPSQPFALHEQVIGGGPTPNERCSLTPLVSSSHPQDCESLLHRLGTRPDRWELTEMQFGLQGGQYLQLCANRIYQKQGEVTLKDTIVNTFESGELSQTYLEDSWGLQISFCTGVCRRVPLRVLLSDCIEAFGDDRLSLSEYSQDWNELKKIFQFGKNLASTDFQHWFAALPPKLQAMAKTVIVYAIGKLQDTGYRDGSFVVAWPCARDAYRCIKLPCKGVNYWMKVLADDENCATFACVTATCLERKDHHCVQACNQCRAHKCREASDMRWNFATVAMNTTVGCQLSYEAAEKLQSPWKIEEKKLYMMGRPDMSLCVLVAAVPCPEKHLVVKKLSLPHRVKSALAAKARLLERQSSSSSATEVLLLADGSF